MRNFTILCLILCMMFIPGAATASDSTKINDPVDPGDKMLDLFFLRPVGFIGGLATTAVFVIGLPVTYPTDGGYHTLHTFVERPWNYVSNRPLGVFHHRVSHCQHVIR